MSWCAYPFKDGKIIEGPRLHSSSYASRMEELSGMNCYWENPDEDDPEFEPEIAKIMHRDLLDRPRQDPCNGPIYWNAILEFLAFCVRNGCGIKVSF